MAGVAGGFVIDRVDQAEKALLFRMIDPGFAIGWKKNLCLAFPVAPITGLGLLIDHRSDLALIGRDGDLALLVEDPDLGNPFSLGQHHR